MGAELQNDPVLVVLYPLLERVQQHLSNIEARVDEFVPRRTISPYTKQRHINVISQLEGRCPCCGIAEILDQGQVLDAEFDHFYSRERTAFEETWLICIDCHQDMKYRADHTLAFQCYQKRAASIESGQLSLI